MTSSMLLLFPMTFVSNIGYVAVAVLGGWLALNGTVRIGDIQAFFQYLSQFTQPIAQVANVANVLQSTAAAAERVFEFLDEDEESAEPAITPKLASVRGAVEFNQVTFGYNADTPNARLAYVGQSLYESGYNIAQRWLPMVRFLAVFSRVVSPRPPGVGLFR